MTPIQERVFSSGHLSADARYRIVVAGEIGPKEIDGMIQFLQLQKSFLEEANPQTPGA